MLCYRKFTKKDSQTKTRATDMSTISTAACKRQLGDTFDDKVYLERLLVSEKARVRYLSRKPQMKVKTSPFSSMLCHLIVDHYSSRSHKIQDIVAGELSYLFDQYNINLKLSRWPKLIELTDRQLARPRTHSGSISCEKFEEMSQKMKKIWNMYLRSQYRTAAHFAVQVLQQVDTWNDNKPNAMKWRFEADLCHLIGLCLDGLRRYRAALAFFQMDARLAEYADISSAKKRALDNIGRMYAQLGLYREALVCWSERLKTDVDGVELAWLLYQISLAYTMLDNLNDALRHCRTCVRVAESIDSLNWALSGHLLLATILALSACREDGTTRQLQASLMSLEEAYKFALRTNRVGVINPVLQIIRTVYQMIPNNSDNDLLESCWSTTLLNLLQQDTTNRTQFNMKALREMLLQGAQSNFDWVDRTNASHVNRND
ncbi:tetratricopeptide repeat protein 25 [Clonorchis sinensis]|uniref:Outer dynein arm-docking complex subunit 4 n=1 Tax=Clonorchis sinensis TaxID=79923 RepID=H2KR21_CLOSI|nr:tetratricopeptide repeat protein 25 [Clonorchis sinensis]